MKNQQFIAHNQLFKKISVKVLLRFRVYSHPSNISNSATKDRKKASYLKRYRRLGRTYADVFTRHGMLAFLKEGRCLYYYRLKRIILIKFTKIIIPPQWVIIYYKIAYFITIL